MIETIGGCHVESGRENICILSYVLHEPAEVIEDIQFSDQHTLFNINPYSNARGDLSIMCQIEWSSEDGVMRTPTTAYRILHACQSILITTSTYQPFLEVIYPEASSVLGRA